MRSFAGGFRNRSPFVLVTAALLLAPAFLLVQAFFASGAWSNIPLHYWLRDPHDDPGVVSWVVGRFKQDPPRVPAVYFVGGSSAREGIVSGASLAADVRRLGGPRIVAANLGSSLQTYSESLAIADNVPAEDAWIVVGVNPTRFAGDPVTSLDQAVGKGMMLKSDYLKRYVADKYGKHRYDPTILPGIFQYLTDLARAYAKGLNSGRLGAARYRLHRVDTRHPLSVATKQHYVDVWFRGRYPQFKKNHAMNMGMLDKLVTRARQRGLHVVLVELPLNLDIVGHRFDEPMEQYQPQVRRLAREHKVPYLDFNADLNIPNNDFYDLQHLTSTGRVIWQRRLAEELVRLMGKADAGRGSS